MLDSRARMAILEMARRGMGLRAIADDLGLSKNTVKGVVRNGRAERPDYKRPEILEGDADRIAGLFGVCKGNLVRVHEELAAGGVTVSYSALTGFCRRHRIGVTEKIPAGRYTFDPGQEMQHDTSPHRVVVGGVERLLQCASVVLAHSTMIFAQVYPTFDRFSCKVFLTEGLRFFEGAPRHCMVDNTNVVVAHGTGKGAVIAPEMVAFGLRFSMVFVAHAVGDANRSAHVERAFGHIENNFYPGRTFTDLADLNAQLRAWCIKTNQTPKRRLQATPVAIYATERHHLQPLPAWIPDVIRVETRRVDVEGYVVVHTNRYPVPTALIDEAVEVHETMERVQIVHRHRVVADHARREPGLRARVPVPASERPRRSGTLAPISREEATLTAAGPEFVAMMEGVRHHARGRAYAPIRRLHRLFLDYPTETLRDALTVAIAHGQYDLARVERMVLQRATGDFFFRLPTPENDDT